MDGAALPNVEGPDIIGHMRASAVSRVSRAVALVGIGTRDDAFWSGRFTDSDPATGRARLCAVVAWRKKVRMARKQKPSFLMKWLWAKLPTSPRLQWLFKKWMYVRHVLPFIVQHRWPSSRASMIRDLDEGWGSSFGEGRNKVEFNRLTHEVRIRGRVFTPRDDRTFVVLVEDDPRYKAKIRVTRRSVATVPGASAEAWNRALNADPVYAEFVRGTDDE